MMKKLLMVGLAALGMSLVGQAMSLEAASQRIHEAATNPATMTAIMKQLSAQDQVTFLDRVNEAIAGLPAQEEERVALYLNANSAALKGAAKGNLTTLLAEVYATVPLTALTVINEGFAKDLLARDANPAKPISDAQMVAIATAVMNKVQERTVNTPNAGERNAFALLTMERAAQGSPANLRETLLAGMTDPATRETAKTTWLPATRGEGQTQTYAPMLGQTQDISSEPPIVPIVLQFAGPQQQMALLADLAGPVGANPNLGAVLPEGSNTSLDFLGAESGMSRQPESDDPRDPWSGAAEEPRGYDYQLED